MKIQRKIHFIILKILYFESVLTGILPVKVNYQTKTLKVSKFLKYFIKLWIFCLLISFIFFCKKILEFEKIQINEFVIYSGLISFYFFSFFTIFQVIYKIDNVISIINCISNTIEIDQIENLLSKGAILEFFVINILYNIVDAFFYSKDKFFWNFPMSILLLSFFPRRFMTNFLIILLHILSEILKFLQKRETSLDTTQQVLVNIFKILSKLDIFVQFTLMFNAVMMVKNSFPQFSHLIRIALTSESPSKTIQKVNLFFFIYLPNEITRIYTIVNSCQDIKVEVRILINFMIIFNKICHSFQLYKLSEIYSKLNPEVSILVKHFSDKISLINNDNRIFLSVRNSSYIKPFI